MNKTKEELEDEKLFADFIELNIEMPLYAKEWSIYPTGETFNPKEDWNLLHKALYKISKIDFTKNSELYMNEELYGWIDLLDSVSLLDEDYTSQCIYNDIIGFIKSYNTNFHTIK